MSLGKIKSESFQYNLSCFLLQPTTTNFKFFTFKNKKNLCTIMNHFVCLLISPYCKTLIFKHLTTKNLPFAYTVYILYIWFIATTNY